MNRRTLLKLGGVAVGTLGVAAAGGRYLLIPPSRRRRGASVDDLASELFLGLDDEQRASTCVPYDHPLRQYHNRGLWIGGERIWRNFSWDQRQLLVDLFYAGLSEAGEARVAEQYFLRWPGIHALNVLICGNPVAPPYQILLSGPHLNLRLGGAASDEVAFGGPQVYGDQRGDMELGLPGNRYRYQLEIATQLFESLGDAALAAATFPMQPPQTQIELRGSNAVPPGVPLGETPAKSRELGANLVASILENYPDSDVEYAQACLAANGGVDALHLSHYENGEAGPAGRFQIFRLEGPAAVFHFRGHPHLHAFLNVGMDGDAPLSVGELLGTAPRDLEGQDVKHLFEAVMRDRQGVDVAFYPEESVVGRLRAGPVRAGDVYNLESWSDRVVTADIDGATLRPALITALEAAGLEPRPDRVHTVATTLYTVSDRADELLGSIESRSYGPKLRDATIDFLRDRGLDETG